MDVNVRAPVLFVKAVIPHLSAGGRIISIGSGLGERVPFPGVTAYAMSKGCAYLFHPRTVARTWPERHYGKPCAARIGGYGRKSGGRCRCRLPAEPYVPGAFWRATRDRERCGLSCKSRRERDRRRHPDCRWGRDSLTGSLVRRQRSFFKGDQQNAATSFRRPPSHRDIPILSSPDWHHPVRVRVRRRTAI